MTIPQMQLETRLGRLGFISPKSGKFYAIDQGGDGSDEGGAQDGSTPDATGSEGATGDDAAAKPENPEPPAQDPPPADDNTPDPPAEDDTAGEPPVLTPEEEALLTPQQKRDFHRLLALKVNRIAALNQAQYGDYEAMKAKAARLDQIENDKKTDMQKAVDQATKAAETRVSNQLIKQHNQKLMRMELKMAAQDANFNDPTDAYAHVDWSKISVNAEGDVVGAAEEVARLVSEKRYLVNQVIETLPVTDSLAGSNGAPPPQEVDENSDSIKNKYRVRG